MNAILGTKSSFDIIHYSPEASQLALQTARNLFQYFGADAQITNSTRNVESVSAASKHALGNVISLGIGSNTSTSLCAHCPVRVSSDQVTLRDETGHHRLYIADGDGLAAIFLRPLDRERLELVIWGVDPDSLATAARFVPMLTGVGQPDFLILTKTTKLKGLEGVLAMGFFDSQWNISKASFLA